MKNKDESNLKSAKAVNFVIRELKEIELRDIVGGTGNTKGAPFPRVGPTMPCPPGQQC